MSYEKETTEMFGQKYWRKFKLTKRKFILPDHYRRLTATTAFAQRQYAISDYIKQSKAAFEGDDRRRRSPVIPLQLLILAMITEMTFERLQSATGLSMGTLKRACRRHGIDLSNPIWVARDVDEPGDPKPAFDEEAPSTDSQKEKYMDMNSESLKSKARRSPDRFQADVRVAFEYLVEQLGRTPSIKQVADFTEFGWGTVKKYWPEGNGDENSVPVPDFVSKEARQEAEVLECEFPSVTIDLSSKVRPRDAMVEGVMKVGNDVWKCDVLAQRDGRWVPQLYAWRVA